MNLIKRRSPDFLIGKISSRQKPIDHAMTIIAITRGTHSVIESDFVLKKAKGQISQLLLSLQHVKIVAGWLDERKCNDDYQGPNKQRFLDHFSSLWREMEQDRSGYPTFCGGFWK